MKWALSALNKFKGQQLPIKETIVIEKELMEREASVLAASSFNVEGFLAVDEEEYLLSLKVEGTLTLPSTRSLEPTEIPLSFEIDERYMTSEIYERDADIEGNELVIVLTTNTLNAVESVIDYTLLNIPLQILTDEERSGKEMPSGDGWQIISEASYLQQQEATKEKPKLDPRLAKLSALLDNNDSDNR